jgi:hypothetical protein
MANQFTKAEAEGREKPKSQNAYTKGKREKMDPLQKAKIRAAFAADKLEAYMKGEIQLDPAQVSAAKILMDKGMPSLQSIEQTNIEEPATEQEIMAQLHSLLANPGTRAQIQAMLAGSPTVVPEDVQSQQTLSGDNKQAA